MGTPLPPIYRHCRRLLVLTEELVRRFTRYHKYTVGTDLRQAAMAIMRTVNQAVHDRPHQAQHVQALVWRVDDYKLTLQLSMDLGVFAQGAREGAGAGRAKRGCLGFQHFEQVATLAATIGKQCGGWWQALAGRQGAKPAAGSPPGADVPPAGTAVSGRHVGAGSKPQPGAAAQPASLSGRVSSDTGGSSAAAEGKP